MRWPWAKRSPPPRIPPYQIPVSKRETPKSGIEVQEHEADETDLEALRAAQSRTGMQRAWDRVTGKFK